MENFITLLRFVRGEIELTDDALVGYCSGNDETSRQLWKQVDESGRNILMIALALKALPKVSALLHHLGMFSQELDVLKKDNEGITLLELAFETEDHSIMKEILDKFLDQINLKILLETEHNLRFRLNSTFGSISPILKYAFEYLWKCNTKSENLDESTFEPLVFSQNEENIVHTCIKYNNCGALKFILRLLNGDMPSLIPKLINKSANGSIPALSYCGSVANFIEANEHYKSLRGSNRLEIAYLLLEFGADIQEIFTVGENNSRYNSLFYCLVTNQPRENIEQQLFLKFLIENGIGLHIPDNESLSFNQLILTQGLLEVFEIHLNNNKDTFFDGNVSKLTPEMSYLEAFLEGVFTHLLHFPSRNIEKVVIERLNDMLKICNRTERYKENLDLLTDFNRGKNCFHLCVFYNLLFVASYLIEVIKDHNKGLLSTLLKETGTFAFTPYHLCGLPQKHFLFDSSIEHTSRLPLVQLFLENGVEMDEMVILTKVSDAKISLLGLTAYTDFNLPSQYELSQYLLEAGGNLQVKSLSGMKLQDIILKKGNFKFIQLASKIDKFEVDPTKISDFIKNVFKGYENNQARVKSNFMNKEVSNILDMLKDYDLSKLLLLGEKENFFRLCIKHNCIEAFDWINNFLTNKKLLKKLYSRDKSIISSDIFLFCSSDNQHSRPSKGQDRTYLFDNLLQIYSTLNKKADISKILAQTLAICSRTAFANSRNSIELIKYVISHDSYDEERCKPFLKGFWRDSNVELTLFLLSQNKFPVLDVTLPHEDITGSFTTLLMLKKQNETISSEDFVSILDAGLKYLTQNNLDLNRISLGNWQENILHFAVKLNIPDAIRWAYSNLADFYMLATQKNAGGFSPFLLCAYPSAHLGLTRNDDRIECARAFIDCGIDINQTRTSRNRVSNALILAVTEESLSEKQIELSQFLIANNIEVSYQVNPVETGVDILLHLTRYDLLEPALRSGQVVLPFFDYRSEFVFQTIQREGQMRLLGRVDPPAQIDDELARFLTAIADKCTTSLAWRARMDRLTLGYHATNVFHLCVINNLPEVAEWILKLLTDLGKLDLISELLERSSNGLGTPLVFTALEMFHIEHLEGFQNPRHRIATILLDYGADINGKYTAYDGDGLNTLSIVLENHSPSQREIDMMHLLIERGITIEPYDIIIYRLMWSGNYEILRKLATLNKITSLTSTDNHSFLAGCIHEMISKAKADSSSYKDEDPISCLKKITTVFLELGFNPQTKDLIQIIMWNQHLKGFEYLRWLLSNWNGWKVDPKFGNLVTVCVISPDSFSAYLMLQEKGLRQAEGCYIQVCHNAPPHRFLSLETEEEHLAVGLRYSTSRKCDVCTGDINADMYLRCAAECDYDVCESCIYLSEARGRDGFGARQLAKRQRKIKYTNPIVFQEKFPNYQSYQISQQHELLLLMNAGIISEPLRKQLTPNDLLRLGLF